MIDNGSGELDFTLRNSEIDMTAGDDSAFLFNAGASTGEVDVRLQGNSLTTGNAAAVDVIVDEGSGNVQFLVTNNTVTNNSAAIAAAEFDVTASRTLNATVGGTGTGNTFANSSATGIAFTADATGNGSRINLDLQGNTGNAGNAVDFELGVAAVADFGVVDRDDTFNDLNNTGNVRLLQAMWWPTLMTSCHQSLRLTSRWHVGE